MKIFKKIFLTLAVLGVVFVVAGWLLPDNYSLERSITISANQNQIHEYVGDLARWQSWSPWKKNDPSIQIQLGDLTKGIGANQKWTSNEGNGELVFVKDNPNNGIEYDLFFNDRAQKSYVKMIYEPQGDQTKVTWSMDGSMNMRITGPYIALMMDKMVGPMLDEGLENLKTVVESK